MNFISSAEESQKRQHVFAHFENRKCGERQVRRAAVFGRDEGAERFRAERVDRPAADRSIAGEKNNIVRFACPTQRETSRFRWIPVARPVRQSKHIGISFAYETARVDIRCIAHAANICSRQ